MVRSGPVSTALRVRAGGHIGLLRLEDVIETMRPLPLSAAGEVVPGLAGLARVRGAAVPVVDLGLLLGGRSDPTRMVTVRAGDRTVALLVDAVDGLVALDPRELQETPPLFSGLAAGAVEAISRADGALALVLKAARLLPASHAG